MKEARTPVGDEIPPELEKRIDRVMVGRAAETERLHRQFDRALDGDLGLAIVYGRPGIGKTFFVHQTVQSFGGATFLHGKFEQYGGRPLSAIAEVTGQAVRHLLTLPTEQLEQLRAALCKKSGSDASFLLSVCPDARILLGDHKPLRMDSVSQLRYRARRAFPLFLSAVATALFPLIIFLDDIQWADELSLQVLDALCKGGLSGTLLVLSSREDSGGTSPSFPAKLEKLDADSIGLGPLSYEDVEQYVALIFSDAVERPDYPSRLLFGLSQGNPFLISRILRRLLQDGVLTRPDGTGKWAFHSANLDINRLPSDIGQLLLRQLDALPSGDRRLLEIVACSGGAASEKLLERVSDTRGAELRDSLDRLCANALLLRKGDDDAEPSGAIYGFIHDVLLRLVYDGVTPEERSRLHYAIASELTAPSDAAAQLMRADPVLLYQAPERWADILFRAGLELRETPAVEQASALFARCAELMGDRGEDTRRLSVRLNLAECLFICERVAEAEEEFESLLAEYPTAEDQLHIQRRYINLCACNGDFEKVMAMGAQILAHLGLKLSFAGMLADLLRCQYYYRGGRLCRLKHAPDFSDERILTALEILTVTLPGTNRLSARTSAGIALKMAALTGRYGSSPYAPASFASYCYVLLHLPGGSALEKARRLEAAALTQLEQSQDAAAAAAAYCILGSLIHHWLHTPEETVRCLERSIAEADAVGASLYGSYAVVFTLLTMLMSGRPLSELRQFIGGCREKSGRLEYALTRYFYDIVDAHIDALMVGTPPETDVPHFEALSVLDKKAFAGAILLNGKMIRLQGLYLADRTDEAYRLAAEMRPLIHTREGFAYNVEFVFYSVLSSLSGHADLPGKERQRSRKTIESGLRELKRCARVCPAAHEARYLLARAQYDALFGHGQSADALLRRAILSAEASGNLALEALAYRLAARYDRGNLKLARFYASESARLYRRWGADYIAGLAEREAAPEPVTDSAVETAPPVPKEPPKPEELAYHLSLVEPMDEDAGYTHLLQVIVRSGLTDYAAVFFESRDTLYLKYEKRANGNVRTQGEPVSLNCLDSMPHRVLRYAARTESEVVLQPDAPRGIFENDAYMTDRGSFALACLPMRFSGVFVGLVYLEKAGPDELDTALLTFIRSLLPFLLIKRSLEAAADAGNAPKRETAPERLTARELDVLRLMAQGKSNAAIGEGLHITQGTVRNHLSSIFSKLEVDNRVKAVLRAGELGII